MCLIIWGWDLPLSCRDSQEGGKREFKGPGLRTFAYLLLVCFTSLGEGNLSFLQGPVSQRQIPPVPHWCLTMGISAQAAFVLDGAWGP